MTSQANLILAAGLLLLLFTGVSCRPEGNSTVSSSSNSSESGQNRSLEQIISDFKLKILKSLKMVKPPTGNITYPRLPKKMIQMLLEKEKEVSKSDLKENMIVRPVNRNTTCLKGNETLCRKFDFNITSDLESIISVHAYFKKMHHHEKLTLSIYDSSELESDFLVKQREDITKGKNESNWVSFEIPFMLAFKDTNNSYSCSMEIEGSDVLANGVLGPFLVITKHKKTIERKKRETENSNENCTCCAESHHITLEDIGWQNWVYSPTEFNIRVCTGECNENLSYFTVNYQRIINAFYKINKTLPRPSCNSYGPFCKG
ncbi:TGF_BETA_2 domain-containing protein [Trichonephila inaurata madagascariensis]|uniref:TGF_BETA_2 domain-containing protein n=1 Tax=Trichonephila inaurata madagascariensis TaxID=2747483 RepID=A0A8X6XZY3_9ARAC|nr:TGF_BETA_2 domain-containing protein [Trichonephila inaurata madagascariensis]